MNAASTSHTVIEQLAQRAHGMTLATIPTIVLEQARLCILDTLGCILAGSRTEEARLITECVSGTGNDSDLVTTYGSKDKRPLSEALLLNGYLGDVLELNDLIGGHASIGNVTAAVGVAQTCIATQGQLLEAVVRGIETTAAVYQAVYPTLKRFTECGIVPVGIPSSIGAAVAVSHLYGFDESRTAHAMAIAGALSGWCPAEVIFGQGGTLKPMLFGAQPAATGVTAAKYAKQGMTGPLHLLESPVGLFATSSRSGAMDSAILARWAMETPRRKLHACCGYIHSSADAVARIHKLCAPEHTLEIHVPPYTADVVAKTRNPESPNDARFHLQYCLALILGGEDVITPDHSMSLDHHLADPQVLARMARIKVVPDDTLTHYERCTINVKNANGDVAHTVTQDGPRGSPQNPLSNAEVLQKFVRLAEPVLGKQSADETALQLMSAAYDAPVSSWAS